MVISKIKHKNRWKNIKTLISSFKFAWFFFHLKIVQFTVLLIVLGKQEVLDGLGIHPRNILGCTDRAIKARKESVQDA